MNAVFARYSFGSLRKRHPNWTPKAVRAAMRRLNLAQISSAKALGLNVAELRQRMQLMAVMQTTPGSLGGRPQNNAAAAQEAYMNRIRAMINEPGTPVHYSGSWLRRVFAFLWNIPRAWRNLPAHMRSALRLHH